MKILVVCSGTKEQFNFELDQVFIFEQLEELREMYDVQYEVFLIEENGLKGYVKSFFKLLKFLREEEFDLIHAHYGYSGFISVFQLGLPKVITFHGTDINQLQSNIISSFSGLFANWNIFVSKKLYQKALFNFKSYSIIPCGIKIDEFEEINKVNARVKCKLDLGKKYVLFSSSFDRKVKNSKLAKEAVGLLSEEVELLELKGYSREEVNLLLNASDVLLMTSFSEGSPQIIKEGMACGIPIVSTNIGEVENIIGDTEGCWLCNFDVSDVEEKLRMALEFEGKTKGRERIKKFNNKRIVSDIYSIYQRVVKK